MRIQIERLEHHADAPAHGVDVDAGRHDVDALDADRARGRFLEAVSAAPQRRIAPARRPAAEYHPAPRAPAGASPPYPPPSVGTAAYAAAPPRGAPGALRLHRAGGGPLGFGFPAVWPGVVLQPLVVGRALVGSDGLAFQLVERLDFGLGCGDDELVIGIEIALG